jgi:hypothetical protein
MNNSKKLISKYYITKLLHFLKYSLIALLITSTIFIAYISFSGPKHFKYVDNLVKNRIELKFPEIKISKIDTAVHLNWKDFSITLNLNKLELNYINKGFFTAPTLKLKLDILNLLLNKTNYVFKGVIIDNKNSGFKYNPSKNNIPNNQDKIPLINFINLIQKYKNIEHTSNFINENFVLDLNDYNGNDYQINLKILDLKFTTSNNIDNILITSSIETNELKLNLNIIIKIIFNKTLDISGSIFSNDTIENPTLINIGKTKINPRFQLHFNMNLSYLNFIEKINFNFQQNKTCHVKNDEFFTKDLNIENLRFKGEILNNFNQINISDLNANVNDIKFTKGTINYKNQKLFTNIDIPNLLASKVLDTWSNNLLPEVHLWLSEHLKGGKITKIQLSSDLNKVDKKPIITSIFLNNVNIKYLNNTPNLHIKNVEVKFSPTNLVIIGENGKILNNPIKKITAKIEDLNQENLEMKFDANINSTIKDQLNLGYAHYKFQKLRNINGQTDTTINFIVPLYKTPDFEDLKFNLKSKLSNVIIDNIYHNYKLTNGELEAELLNDNLLIKGNAKINELLNLFINANLSITNKRQYKIEIDINDKLQYFHKIKFPFSEFFSDRINVKGIIKANNKNIISEFWANLFNTSVNISQLSIVKKQKLPGKLNIKFINNWEDETKISKFEFKIPNKHFSGSGTINNKINELVKFQCNVLQNNVQGITLNYDKVENINKIELNGIHADFSDFNPKVLIEQLSTNGLSTSGFFTFNAKLDNILLRNNIKLHKVNVSINNQRSKSINLSALTDQNHIIRVYYNFPVLSVITSDAGTIFKALDITNNITDGDLEIKGTFETHKDFKGFIALNQFYVTKIPALLNLLTLTTPFSTLQSIIKNKGINFYNLKCPIEYNDKYLEFNDCIAESKLLALKLSGNIDLKTKYLNSKGIIVPQNIFNTIFNKIPFLNLFSGPKNEGAILSTLFDMNGYIDKDIKVKANYLSTLTPGFLRNIFKRPISKPKHKVN